jgi:hypothetical protein
MGKFTIYGRMEANRSSTSDVQITGGFGPAKIFGN